MIKPRKGCSLKRCLRLSVLSAACICSVSCGQQDEPKIFDSVSYDRDSDSTFFKVAESSESMTMDIYADNAECTMKNIDLGRGDFIVSGIRESCTRTFHQKGREIGFCTAEKFNPKALLIFAVSDAGMSFGNPGEPIAGAEIPIPCHVSE